MSRLNLLLTYHKDCAILLVAKEEYKRKRKSVHVVSRSLIVQQMINGYVLIVKRTSVVMVVSLSIRRTESEHRRS